VNVEDARATGTPVTVIVLAAGEGTRMRSAALPKTLHSFAGRSLLGHVVAATSELGATTTAVVVGHRREQVVQHLAAIAPEAVPVVQDQQLGTGHAVRVALEQLAARGLAIEGTVLVVPGDAPLLTAGTLADLLAEHRAQQAAATMLTSVVPDPTGYGRILRAGDDTVLGVVEHADASPEQREIREVSALVYAFDAALLRAAVTELSTDNAQGEEYLPEVLSIFLRQGRTVRALLAPATEIAGVNDRVQLAAAHRAYNDRLLDQHMRNGVTVIDPATTWVDADVLLAADAVLRPNVQLHGSTRIDADAVIGPDSTLTDTVVGAGSSLERTVARQSSIGAGATVGPFAYLRPGTVLADQVHIGTYVEIKGSDIGLGTKVPHLSYVGDASIGEHTNIGAATVFVNYDGVHKHRSTVGSHVRTGADNMFVAPVHVGDGAYTAAGTVVTNDVPPGALGVGRGRQRNVAGWVRRRRAGTKADLAAQAALAATGGTGAADSAGTEHEQHDPSGRSTTGSTEV